MQDILNKYATYKLLQYSTGSTLKDDLFNTPLMCKPASVITEGEMTQLRNLGLRLSCTKGSYQKEVYKPEGVQFTMGNEVESYKGMSVNNLPAVVMLRYWLVMLMGYNLNWYVYNSSVYAMDMANFISESKDTNTKYTLVEGTFDIVGNKVTLNIEGKSAVIDSGLTAIPFANANRGYVKTLILSISKALNLTSIKVLASRAYKTRTYRILGLDIGTMNKK